MKTLNHVSDSSYLISKGVEVLTAEACAYSGRLLCSLTEEAHKLLCQFLSVEVKLNENLNKRGGAGNIMMTRNMLWDFAVFMLFNDGATDVFLRKDGSLTAIVADDNENLPNIDFERHWWISSNIPRNGLGNIHQFTGISF